MSRICEKCQKGSLMVTNLLLLRGHYNPTTRKRKYPNLQWATLPNGTRIKVCKSCLKTIYRTA